MNRKRSTFDTVAINAVNMVWQESSANRNKWTKAML